MPAVLGLQFKPENFLYKCIFLERIKVLSKYMKKIFNIISHHGKNHKKTAGITWYTEGRRERVRNSKSISAT